MSKQLSIVLLMLFSWSAYAQPGNIPSTLTTPSLFSIQSSTLAIFASGLFFSGACVGFYYAYSIKKKTHEYWFTRLALKLFSDAQKTKDEEIFLGIAMGATCCLLALATGLYAYFSSKA